MLMERTCCPAGDGLLYNNDGVPSWSNEGVPACSNDDVPSSSNDGVPSCSFNEVQAVQVVVFPSQPFIVEFLFLLGPSRLQLPVQSMNQQEQQDSETKSSSLVCGGWTPPNPDLECTSPSETYQQQHSEGM